MAGRIDDIDFDAVIHDTGILRFNGDAPLPLLVHRIQNALSHARDVPVCPCLTKNGIHQRRLTVVHVCNDGDVAKIGATHVLSISGHKKSRLPVADDLAI